MALCKIISFLTMIFLAAEAFATFDFYEARPSRNYDYLYVESYEKEPQSFLGISYDWLNAPVLSYTASNQTKKVLISNASVLELAGNLKLENSWSLGADLEVFDMTYNDSKSQAGINDLRLTLKKQFTAEGSFHLATVYEAFIPTGNSNLLLSSGNLGIGGLLVGSVDLADSEISANVGYRWMPGATDQGIDETTEIPLQLGLRHSLGEWSAAVENHTSVFPANSKTFEGSETLISLQKDFDGYRLALGGGVSSLENNPEPDYRLFLGIKFRPRSEIREIHEVKEVKTVETVRDCSNQPLHLSYQARPLTNLEIEALPALPYLSKGVSSPMKVLNLGQMTNLSANGMPSVKDAQVVMAFDIFDLPPRDWIQKIQSMSLQIFVSKLEKKANDRSEVLCLLGVNICSGELREKNVNPFFFNGKDTPNDYFSRQYLNNTPEAQSGEKIQAGELSLDVSRLLENSLLESPLDVLYSSTLLTADGKRRLIVVIAGDTYVKPDAKLEVMLSVNTCGGNQK